MVETTLSGLGAYSETPTAAKQWGFLSAIMWELQAALLRAWWWFRRLGALTTTDISILLFRE